MPNQTNRSRISAPVISDEAKAMLTEIGIDQGGLSCPALIAQLAESTKNGKKENWLKALLAFQEAMKK